MRSLIFEKLELLSLTARTARTIEFHPRLTVITGENNVGKSSVIKSIYWTLGTAPAVISSKWSKINVKALLTFTIDAKRYRAIRNQDRVAVFDSNNELLISTNSFTKELGPFLASLLDFKLVFPNKHDGRPETPPPAYAFVPFYVDQDGGWGKPLTSFDHLTQYANYKKPVIEFHAGIKPNRYYELIAEKKKLDIDLKELEHDRRVVLRAVERLNLEPTFTGLELSASEHDASVEDLLARLKSLRDTRQTRTAELADILDQRTLLEQQAAIVQAAANESALDAQWAVDDGRDEIPCPTCGTLHRNDFSNRFAILADREECFEFLNDAHQKIRALVRQAQRAEQSAASTSTTISEIESILERRQGEVTLREVIESEGRRAASEVFKGQIQYLDGAIGQKLAEISQINEEIKKISDRNRKKSIESYYASLMTKYLKDLNVLDPDLNAVTKITGRIIETGSEQPRLLLSYILALADTIQKFTTAFTAPLIIDSPVQQEQDTTNAPAIIQRVTSERPNGGQVIVGTISLHGIEVYNAKVVAFDRKQSVLLTEEYEEVYEIMNTFLQRI